jgi:hypothetical protein
MAYPELGHTARLQQLREVDDLLNLRLFVVFGRYQGEGLGGVKRKNFL